MKPFFAHSANSMEQFQKAMVDTLAGFAAIG